MNSKIETIIFDLGGVLVDWKPEYVYRKVFNNDEKKVQWFLNTVCTPEWNIEQDAGRTIEEGVNIKIKEFPQYEEWIRLFYNEWHNMFSGPIQENVELFKDLKNSGNYNIYALTNWSAEKWDLALELFPFFKDFDGVVVSGREKTRKPFPEIYTLILNRFNINPKSTIFIDDNFDNVQAAKTLDIQSISYTPSVDLKLELKKFNVQ